jgi:hypothetical protein
VKGADLFITDAHARSRLIEMGVFCILTALETAHQPFPSPESANHVFAGTFYFLM